MAVEARRGCGYRKVGGLYLVSGILSEPCHRLPLELHVCATCGQGVKQTRGWTWVQADKLFGGGCKGGVVRSGQYECSPAHCKSCPVCFPQLMGERQGLLW